MTWSDSLLLLPEVLLVIGACALLLAPVLGMRDRDDAAKWSMLVLLAVVAVATVLVAATGTQPSATFGAMFTLDAFALFFKYLLIVAIALVTILSEGFLKGTKYSSWEYYSLMAFALCGMMFMASGVHLASIYVGLELMSLSSYILAGYFKNEQKSTEAAMKYFVLGALSSAILLYGISLIYGVTGKLGLADIATAIAGTARNDALMFGIMLLGAGLCFKVAAAPFHVWTPDVYEGAPTPITAFLSTASKVAAFAIFARIFYVAFTTLGAEPRFDWQNVLAVIAALTMIVGNLAAITQDNVKRLLAYSSIGHAGYVLLGIISVSTMGLRGVLVYSVVYIFANLGIWATVLTLSKHEYAGEQIDDFEGLAGRSPFWALAMVIFLLSLGGIPPTAGFIGKYFLFYSAIGAGYAWLAIIAVLMSAVSMFYYLRIVVAMYLKEGKVAEVVTTPALRFVAIVCLVITLLFGVLPSPLIHQVENSAAWVATRATMLSNAR
ncbi:MAG: NADH-quinone oxidoreductase subunit N [Thermoanaerobaculia bacterium]